MKNIIIINLLLILIFSCTFAEDTPKTEEKSDSPEPTYTVTYKSDYGTVPSKISGLKKGDILTAEQMPELTTDGYKFAGWYNGENEVTTEYKITGDMELTAKWNVNTYTVKFNANGGSGEMVDMSFSYNKEKALTSNTFTREDYTFVGWATTADGEVIYADEQKVSNLTAEDKATVRLYAVWNENDKVLPVIFSVPNETAVDCGDSVTLSCGTDGAKIYYTIDGVTSEYSNAIVITKNVTITAFATKDGMKDSNVSTASYTIKTYTVTYTTEYGVAPSDVAGLKKGDILTAEQLPVLTTDGYTFAGWYNGENEVMTGHKITGDLELTAKWNANTDTTYKVEHYQQNINDAGYTLVNSDTENKYGTTGENTSATVKSYVGFTEKTIEQMKISADGSTVVKIYYDRNIITLKLKLDGGEGEKEITGKYGATVTVSANPTKTGYTFDSWSPPLPAALTENVTYTANWTANTYTIIYNLDGGKNAESNPTNYTVETDTITLANATRTSYAFLGWYDENGNKITEIVKGSMGTVSLHAKWQEGFVYVQGATITGAIMAEGYTKSEIFKDGKNVTVGDFYMSDHEVTQAEYETYCSYGGEDKPNAIYYGKGDNYPAYYVSWYDALVYCNKRSIAEGLTPCYTIKYSTDPDEWGTIPSGDDIIWNAAICDFTVNGYRLPTEAEWEYAARGGNRLTGTQYTYAGRDTIVEVAWYENNSPSNACKVKTRTANGLGLYDMSGNMWEWCWDVDSNSERFLRGGGWNAPSDLCMVSSRGSYGAYNRNYLIGFRVVRTA